MTIVFCTVGEDSDVHVCENMYGKFLISVAITALNSMGDQFNFDNPCAAAKRLKYLRLGGVRVPEAVLIRLSKYERIKVR